MLGDLPVISVRVKYKNSSATLTEEYGIHIGSIAMLLTLCFLNNETLEMKMGLLNWGKPSEIRQNETNIIQIQIPVNQAVPLRHFICFMDLFTTPVTDPRTLGSSIPQ